MGRGSRLLRKSVINYLEKKLKLEKKLQELEKKLELEKKERDEVIGLVPLIFLSPSFSLVLFPFLVLP